MKRIGILYEAYDKQQAVNLSKLKTWQQRNDYHELNNRIDGLFVLACFLSLRRKIKETVENNYHDLKFTSYHITDLICDGIDEYENYYIDNWILRAYVLSYAEFCFSAINNKTLKLEI